MLLLLYTIYSCTKPERTTRTFVLCYLICIVHHTDKGSPLLRQPVPPPHIVPNLLQAPVKG